VGAKLELEPVSARMPADLVAELRRAVEPGGIVREELGLTTMSAVLETGTRRLLMEAEQRRAAREGDAGDVPA